MGATDDRRAASSSSGVDTGTEAAFPEKRADDAPPRTGMQDMPLRQYLDTFVVPTLMPGLKAIGEERPENPVEWLAHYLLKNNPDLKRTKAVEGDDPNDE